VKLDAIDRYFDPAGPGCNQHPNAHACAVSLLREYLRRYTGPLFDPRGDEPWWDPNAIRSTDLMAVASLSMPGFAQRRFQELALTVFDSDSLASQSCLPGCGSHVRCLLRQVPSTASIFEPDAGPHLDRMNDIWAIIRANPALRSSRQFGYAGISKLLGRKRPALVPILDSVAMERVKRANEGKRPSCSWCFIRTELSSSTSIATNVATARARANAPAWITDLRVIDVVVWMRDATGCDKTASQLGGPRSRSNR
jgi:hypothetical protein